MTALRVTEPAGKRSAKGRVRLAGLAIAAPRWQEEIDAWCDVVGLDPPADGRNGLRLLGATRRRPLSVSLVEPLADGAEGPLAWLMATTDDLDHAVSRAAAHGSPILSGPERDDQGNRVAVLKGPVGMSVRVVELLPRARLSLLVDQAPRRTESHLRASAAVSSMVALAISGYFSWLAVERSPRHQVSFGFLIGFCSLFATAASLTGYPNGLLGGEDDHGRGVVRTLRAEVAGVDPTDLGGSGWAMWQRAVVAAGVAAACSLLVLGLMSAALLGRPIGFWLLWAWTAAIAGTAMVLSGALARRRGVLTAGRRAHGLPTVAGPPVPLLRRAWLIGAVPLGLVSAMINAGLAWTAYRYGVSTKTLGSDLLASVIVTSGIGYLLARQWGRADWSAGRLIVPDALLLPDKVRLGAQGLVFAVVAELIVLNLAGHALGHPPAIAAAIAMRSIAGLVAGTIGAGLGEVAGALNAAAETREARP